MNVLIHPNVTESNRFETCLFPPSPPESCSEYRLTSRNSLKHFQLRVEEKIEFKSLLLDPAFTRKYQFIKEVGQGATSLVFWIQKDVHVHALKLIKKVNFIVYSCLLV
jgi:hypothetical protein